MTVGRVGGPAGNCVQGHVSGGVPQGWGAGGCRSVCPLCALQARLISSGMAGSVIFCVSFHSPGGIEVRGGFCLGQGWLALCTSKLPLQ